MPRETIERLRAVCPNLATNYGMTETSSAITLIEPTSDLDILANTVGRPRPGIEMRLVDQDGQLVGCDRPGEIQVRSNSNFLGYWQQAGRHSRCVHCRWFLSHRRSWRAANRRTDPADRAPARDVQIRRLQRLSARGGSRDRSTPWRRDRRSGVCSPILSGRRSGSPMSCPATRSRRNRSSSTVASAWRTTSCRNTSCLPQICHCCPSARSTSARYAFGPSACAPTKVTPRDGPPAPRCIATHSRHAIHRHVAGGAADRHVRHLAHRRLDTRRHGRTLATRRPGAARWPNRRNWRPARSQREACA